MGLPVLLAVAVALHVFDAVGVPEVDADTLPLTLPVMLGLPLVLTDADDDAEELGDDCDDALAVVDASDDDDAVGVMDLLGVELVLGLVVADADDDTVALGLDDGEWDGEPLPLTVALAVIDDEALPDTETLLLGEAVSEGSEDQVADVVRLPDADGTDEPVADTVALSDAEPDADAE